MFKKTLLILTTLSSLAIADIYDLKPQKITKDITCFIGDFNPPTKENKGFVSNVCYVDMGKTVVVIEAGPTYNFAKELNEVIKKELNKKVTHVITTNFHDDRYTGASYYKEKNIPIVAHKTIVEELEKNPGKFYRIPKVTTKEEYAKSKVVEPDILTENRYTIKGSNKTIEILKLSPGSNSKSDISVYVVEDKFIFTGNTVFNGRFIKYGKNSNINNWIAALEKLKTLDIKYNLGGHGGEYDKSSYKNNLEYLKLLKKSVREAYENDVEREDINKYVDDKKFSFYNHYETLSKYNAKAYYDQLEWEIE
ncbi:MAG: MBL fold metallo-hydrolase [Campylobacterota bacterium]|nr:MBL fold metallo-hydrolase [Campylobacterota bacterium]